MTAETKWPAGPYYFLEAGNTEAAGNAGRPLTICSDVDDTDLANVYSADDSTVETTREQAVALAHLFAAAPELYAALDSVMREIVGTKFRGNTFAEEATINEVWAAIKKARGEQ